MEAISTMKSKHDDEINRIQSQYEVNQTSLNSKLNELQLNFTSVQSENTGLRSELKETKTELGLTSSELNRIKVSFENEVADRKRLEESLRKSEREFLQLSSKYETVQQQLKDKEDLVQQTLALRNAAEEAKSLSEEKLEIYTSTIEAYQEKFIHSTNEINKGNGVITKLNSDLKQLKEKLQLKSEVIRRQVIIHFVQFQFD